MARLISLFLLSWSLSNATAVQARSLEIPLTLRQAFFEQLISQQLFAESGKRVRVWDDGKNCNYLELSDPQLDFIDRVIRTRSRAYAQVGTALAGSCLSVIQWQGFVEVDQRPALGIEPGTVQFRVNDSRVFSEDGESSGAVGTVWEWVKKHVQPRFERLHVDINPVLSEIRQLMPLVYPQQPPPIQRILKGITLTGVTLNEEQLQLLLQLDLPPAFIKSPLPIDEPALTSAEMERWQRSWQQWDAFLTYFIRQAGEDTNSAEIRTELLAVLIEARRDLVSILTEPVTGEDPVADLFITTWQRLEPVLQEVSEQLPPDSALRYATFMTAADVLATIESVENQTGFTLNADAMRRLARLANPDLLNDPLEYNTDIDPALREVFGFGPPLPLIPLAPLSDDPQSSISKPDIAKAVAGMGGGYMLSVLPLLALQDSHYVKLVERLNGWVPTISVLDEYLPLVQQLLDRVVGATLNERGLDKPYLKIYRPLVLATAWQESCWRQYIKKGNEVAPIRSHAGAVGIMQVNQHVWRGFYDINALQYDVGYNAMAGAEIVYHYLVDYAIARQEDKHPGGIENLARATYAMYNGGPRHRDRYRRENVSSSLRAIDKSFLEKYEKVHEGDPLVVAECYGG